jgi:hypothetical protein
MSYENKCVMMTITFLRKEIFNFLFGNLQTVLGVNFDPELSIISLM